MKKTLSWIMVLLMVFAPFAATVINVSAEVLNQDNTAAGTQSEAEQSPVNVDTISTTMNMSPIPEQTSEPPYEIVVVHCSGGSFTGEKANYPTLNVTLQGDRQLPDDLSWYQPVRSGYRFNGWYADEDGTDGTEYKEGDRVPEEVTDLYPRWMRIVVLDAEPGSFTSDNREEGSWNYTRTVDIVDGKFPKDTETPVYNIDKDEQTVEFVGWFTKKCTITRIRHDDEEGAYWTWSIENNGEQIQADQEVPEGITTLYAGYKVKDEGSSKKTITYYYDWNGINGMWGHCLTSSRVYNESEKGYKLTVGDLLIRYLNWGDDDVSKITTQDELNEYWKDKKFDGYTFLGWAKTPKAEAPDVNVNDVIKDGESLYAVWKKDGMSNKDFDRSDPEVGPLQYMRFLNLNYYAHGVINSSITVSLFTTPIKAEMPEVTWTLTYGVPNQKYVFAPPITKTAEVKDGQPFDGPGFTAKVNEDGRTLTIENTDGKDHSVMVSAKAVLEDGTSVTTPADATVTFGHNWVVQSEKHVEPTCSTRGSDSYQCKDCEATKTEALPMKVHTWDFQITKAATCTEEGIMQDRCRYCGITFEDYQKSMNEIGVQVKPPTESQIIPALGHNYEVTSTDSIDENGMRCFTEECSSCQTEESGQYGDVNKDGEVSLVDAVQMYQFLNEQVDSLSQEVAGDIDGSNDVTEGDAEKLYEYVSGQTPSL